MYVCMYVLMCIYISICWYGCMYLCTHLYQFVDIDICMYIHIPVCRYGCIYVFMEEYKEINPTIWRNAEKTKQNPKFDEFIMKVDVECFGCNNFLQDFKFMKKVIKIVMDIRWNNRWKESVYKKKGAHGVMVIVVGNGHEFKFWTRLIAFHIALIPLGKVWIQLFSLQLWVNSRTD